MLLALVLASVFATGSPAAPAANDVVLYDNGPFSANVIGKGPDYGKAAVDVEKMNRAMPLGISCVALRKHRLSDDFLIPTGARFEINSVRFQMYVPFDLNPRIESVSLQIWNGKPNETGKVIYEESIMPKSIARFPTGKTRCYQGTTDKRRPIFDLTAKLKRPVLLASGTYWLDWSIASKERVKDPSKPPPKPDKKSGPIRSSSTSIETGPISVYVTKNGLPGKEYANGIQYIPRRGWTSIQVGQHDLPVDLCFQILGKKLK